MASVLLGLCEEPVTSKAATLWNINKLGGTPDWYQSTDLHPNCALCGNRSVFICQLYCPISGSSYHRTVYVFACCNQPCRNKDGSWTVLRFQSPYKPETKRLLTSKCDTDYWGIDEASWSDDDDDDNHHDIAGIAKSESPNDETEVVSARSELDSSMDIGGDQEPSDELHKVVIINCTNTEINTKMAPTSSVFADEETVTKMSHLNVTDVGCTEMEAGSSSSAADEDEVEVVAEDLVLNPKDSILSKVLVNSQLSSSSEGSNSLLTENCLTSIVLDSYYINAYDETEFVADMKHWLDRENKYLKEDSALRSFLQGCDELSSGKQRKQKKSKKPSHLDIEKDENNEYDKKPDNFDRAVVKFSEKLKLCPHQVIRYSYNGTPLHFQEQGPKQTIPTCSCGSPRIFEMQLMPGMVEYLRMSEDSADYTIEFGSVYIYTCSKSCWDDDERTEAKQEFILSVEYLDQGLFRT